MRLRSLLVVCALLVPLFAAPAAQATVDAYLPLIVPYKEMQTNDICFMKTKMWAQLGVPGISAMRGLLRSVLVYREGTDSFANINLLVTSPAMVPSYVSDGYVGNVYEYRMKLDVTALRNANGTTVAGRTATVRAAKLALLSMAKTLSEMTGGRYRLWVTFIGLPSQSGLPGTYLYPSTTYAYTNGSALLAAYEAELINLEGSCR